MGSRKLHQLLAGKVCVHLFGQNAKDWFLSDVIRGPELPLSPVSFSPINGGILTIYFTLKKPVVVSIPRDDIFVSQIGDEDLAEPYSWGGAGEQARWVRSPQNTPLAPLPARLYNGTLELEEEEKERVQQAEADLAEYLQRHPERLDEVWEAVMSAAMVPLELEGCG